jgi:DNA-binding transcriptional LysR family regulator
MLKVTLRRLEVFVAILDAGSFAAAAQRLEIAQPSVSAHVRALEQAVGGSLFERRPGRAPELTPLGRSIAAHARDMVAEATVLGDCIINSRPAVDRVIFSCQRSLANYALKTHLAEFALGHPEIQLVIRIGKQEEVVSDVRDGSADIGCFLGNEELRGLAAEVVGHQRLLLVCAPHHPLAGKHRVRPAELGRHGFVGPPPLSLFGRALAKLLASTGLHEIEVVAQATEYQFLRELVRAGVGISCSPELSVAEDVASGYLAAIDFAAPELLLEVRQVVAPRRARTRAAEQLERFLAERRHATRMFAAA